MRRAVLIACLLLQACSRGEQAAGQEPRIRSWNDPPRFELPAGLENLSGVEIVPCRGEWGVVEICKCRNLARVASHLSELGLEPGSLGGDVPCATGDFDGNGSLDFAIGSGPAKYPPELLRGRFVVLLFEGPDVIKTQVFPDEGDIRVYAKGRGPGSFGEPATELDGLVHWGAGGDTYIHLYNKSTGQLETRDFPSEGD